MAVHITGTMGLPSGAIYPNCKMYFERQAGVVSQEGYAVVPEKTVVQSNGAAEVDFYLLYGNYIGNIQTTLGLVKFAFSVLDVAAADFTACIGDVSVPIPEDSVQRAEDAADRAEAAAGALVTYSGYVARASEPLHDDFKILKDGVWYSPDWLILVSAGQSNAVGVAGSTDGPKTVNPNVYAWNNISAPVVATLGAAPFNTAVGAPNNIWFHQAAWLSEMHQRPVMIVTLPVSGSPIGSWFAGQANWDAFEAQINAALLHPALWGQTTVDVFGFHLGESAHDALQYTLAPIFQSFIRQCQTRTWSAPDMVFVAGEMLRQEDGGVAYNAIEEWRKAISGGDIERAFLASSEGLTKNADGTDVHLDGASLAILGQRYAHAPTGARVTDVRTDTRDVSETMIWKGQFYTKLTDTTSGPSNVDNQNAVVNVIRSDIPVVFEVDGVRNEVLTVVNAATLLLAEAADARVKIWYPSAMMGDAVPAAELPGVTFSNPSGNGTMRRLWVNPRANLRLLFVEGHNLLQHDLNTAMLPQSLTGLRFKSCAKLTFNGFKASALPPALTLLDFSGTTPVPGLVRAAIDAENTLRSAAITVTYSGLYASEGFRRLRPEDFGASGLGVVDDGLAMARFTAWGGTLELTPGANYRITAKQVMNLPAGAVIEGNGASITLEYTDTSDGLSFAAGVGSTIKNVIFRFPNNAGTAHYQERMLGLSTGVKLIDCQFIAAVAQPVSADDIRDGCVRVLGEDVVIDGCSFYNVYRCIQMTMDASTARGRVSNTRFDLYGKGVDTGGTFTGGVLENLTFGDASTAALPDPGVNAITELSADLTIRGVRVEGTGEHGIYMTSSVYTSGLVMTDIQVRGSGQCNIKLRRATDFILADLHGWDTSLGNAPGTNEDVLHLECCRNGRVIGVSGGEVSANGGYEGVFIDACSDIDFFDVLLRGTSSDFIYITDANGPADASPPTLGNLRFWGVRCFAPGAVPLLNIQSTGTVGPIHLDGVDYRNATGSAVVTNIGGAATDIVVRGNISTSGTMHTNTAGGASVQIEAFWDRYIGGSLQRSYIDGKFTMYSGQFDMTDGDSVAFFARSTGTAGSGAYIGGYGGSQINSGRPGWAMVGKQGTADPDQVGVAVLVHNSASTNDTLIEAAEITYQGDVKALRAIKTQAVAVASLPSASSIGAGGRSMVTDANATTFNSIVAAGGANIVPVFSDGTNWRIG